MSTDLRDPASEEANPPRTSVWLTVLGMTAWCAVACVGEPIADDASDADPMATTTAVPVPEECSQEVADALYAGRVAPLMSPEHVDSCNRCHFAGVELRNYVRESPCATMACMAESGAVDLDDPASSQVLAFIRRGTSSSALIDDEIVAAEHAAMLAWIEYSAACGAEVCEPIDAPCGDAPATGIAPEVAPEALLRGCDEASLVQAFDEELFALNARCAHCHATNAALPPDAEAATPQWMAPPEHPDAARLTLYNLLAIDAIDGAEPRRSRLLLKPLSPALGGIEHGGGFKIDSEEDLWFTGVIDFATLYGRCSGQLEDPP